MKFIIRLAYNCRCGLWFVNDINAAYSDRLFWNSIIFAFVLAFLNAIVKPILDNSYIADYHSYIGYFSACNKCTDDFAGR